jgi:3-hydroxyisobutyrate dehydrogenase-like beta-hydroxyacid dehydrogenase
MFEYLGFIGVGVMGEPMCRNLVLNQPQSVMSYDMSSAPLERLAADGVRGVKSLAEICAEAHTIFLSLPAGEQVHEICLCEGGLLAHLVEGQCVVDCGTSPPELARELYAAFAARGVAFADAPVARTRQAAIDGTLSIMVGSDDAVFSRIQPLLACMASDITHCGGPGAGQTVKILNNMMLFQNCAALAEALAIARRSGLDEELFLQTVGKSSGDSFALRNHATKAMLPREYPEGAFSVRYAMKDLDYALELAAKENIDLKGAEIVRERFEQAIREGFGEQYHPVVREVIDS